MAKSNGKDSKKGKGSASIKNGKINKKTKKTRFTLEQKWFCCKLKKSEKRPKR